MRLSLTSARDARRATGAVAALFAFLGFHYATWAARLPALKTRLGLEEEGIGLLLMVCGIGSAVSYPLVTASMRRLGSRRLSLLSALVLVGILLGLAVAPDYPTALALLFLDGVAVGALNVAMNAQGAALETVYRRKVMSRLHAVFSGGLLAAALVASAVGSVSSAVLPHFGLAAALLLGLLAYAGKGLLADGDPGTAPEDKPPAGKRRVLAGLNRATAWMALVMLFGTVAEGAMNDWSALYLKDVAGASPSVAPLGIAVVSGSMLLARLFSDRWRTRLGDGRVVWAGAVVAGLGLILALVVGGAVPGLIGFACVGLGMAAVTPCVYVVAAARGAESLTLVATCGTTGLLIGPAVIGLIAGASNLRWGMTAVALSCLVVAVASSRVPWPADARRE